MALLDSLPEYADKLDTKSVTDKIWPNLVSTFSLASTSRISDRLVMPLLSLGKKQTGFGDTVAVIREATVRSIIYIAPKVRSNTKRKRRRLLIHMSHLSCPSVS